MDIPTILNELFRKWQDANIFYDVTFEFKKLQTDQERVKFVLNIMHNHIMFPSPLCISKDFEKSKKLLAESNNLNFKNADEAIQALILCTQSIAFTPTNPSKQLAIAYADRSTILFKFGLYSECIEDINRALSLDYPEEQRVYLHFCRIKCLALILQKPARDMLKKTRELVAKMPDDAARKNLEKEIDVLCDIFTKVKFNTSDDKVTPAKFIPTFLSSSNEVPCASDKITVKYNMKYGRHVVATCDISPGETIILEKPYSSVLARENVYTHCSYCLKPYWASIPCKHCPCVMYCSKECKETARIEYHDIECLVLPYLSKYNFVDNDLFSLKLAVLAIREAGGIKNLRAMLNKVDKCDDPRMKGFSEDGKFHSNKYISFYSLTGNTEKRLPADLFRRTVEACVMLYILATHTNMFDTKLSMNFNLLAQNDDVTFIGGLILRHQQIIPNNCHSFDEERDLNSITRATVALPFCSLLNHGCYPNVFRHSRFQHIAVLVLRPIKKGEQILDNYGEHYATTPSYTRIENLQKAYFFTCDCVACQNDWPVHWDLNSYNTLVMDEIDKDKVKYALENFELYFHMVEKGSNKSAIIEKLITMLQVLHKYVEMPCQEISSITETLKRAIDLHGNVFVKPNLVPIENHKLS